VLDEKGCDVVQTAEELSGRASNRFCRPIALFQAQEAVQRGAQPFGYIVQAFWHSENISTWFLLVLKFF
jgi:hypothetical protein